MESNTRRKFLGYLAGSAGALTASALFWMSRREEGPEGPYRVVDTRNLPIGGLGLFVTVDKGLDRDALIALGEEIRQEYRAQPNMVVNIFDDAEAARTVKKGSRTIAEETFQAAMSHQVAYYIKDSRTGQHTFTLEAPPEVLRYRDA